MSADFDLQRFVKAQEADYARALSELRAGRKQSHWMWYIFPQLAGLGRSEMARRYALSGREEALAYLERPLLGARLEECTLALLSHDTLTAHQILGSPDDLKLHSCMTLFARVAPENPLFQQALDRYFAGKPDEASLRLLGGGAGSAP
ncbi:DUF1810 domain-containing protein [Stutzerimonas nosocomialis]|uniref:DUF1810 domain-containing protein n=1 Tax=Stutzerimonas nosocomialis TaxID=1056496 RepID=UPI0011089CEC|nr:DUF1810 domain-containing protein [Stutzerimonas nosocomialis]TLX55865.1 DUF1810 domain-containing protein [Stutzerimonas nosocomialis]